MCSARTVFYLRMLYAIFVLMNRERENRCARAKCMLKVSTKERSRSNHDRETRVRHLLVVFYFNIIYVDWSWFIYLFLRAIILVLITNYSSLKRGLSVKRAHRNGGSSQLLHNLVLFKLYLPAFGAFSFWRNYFHL